MGTFEDYKTAFQMRDTVDRLVVSVMERERPRARYAAVASWDRELKTAMVQYPEGGDPMPVQMGSVQPTYLGQLVKVEGVAGDKIITQVYGQAHYETWPRTMGDANERFILLFNGGSGNNNYGYTPQQFSGAYFGWYNLSNPVNGNWIEDQTFLRRGKYIIQSLYTAGTNIGRHVVLIDGVQVDPPGTFAEGYNSPVIAKNYLHTFAHPVEEDGLHTVRVLNVGKHATSVNYFTCLSALHIIRNGDLS